MKKLILLAAAIAFTGVAAHAQYIGLKAGINLSNLNINGADDENMRFGLNAGGYVNLPLGDILSIQPELLYSTKGSTAEYDISGLGFSFEGKNKLKLDYIDLPVLVTLNIGDALELQAGPYIGFLLNASASTEGDFGDAGTDFAKSNFKNLDYGLAGGVAFNLEALQLGARYNYGLQEIGDSDAAALFNLDDAKNAYLQIFAALRFGDYD